MTDLNRLLQRLCDAEIEFIIVGGFAASLSVCAKLPGHYENEEDFVDCTPLEYAQRFPGAESPGSNRNTRALLQEWTHGQIRSD